MGEISMAMLEPKSAIQLFGVKAVLVLSALLVITYVYYVFRLRTILKWPTVQGRLEKVELPPEAFERVSDRRFSADWIVIYRYSVDGDEYIGKQVTVNDLLFKPAHRTSVARHLANACAASDTVKVYYDPSKPAKCVLSPRITVAPHLIGFVLAVGTWVFWGDWMFK